RRQGRPARPAAEGRRHRLGPRDLQGPHPARHLRPADVRDLVQDDPAGAVGFPPAQGAEPPAPGRRVPEGLRPDGVGPVGQGRPQLELIRARGRLPAPLLTRAPPPPPPPPCPAPAGGGPARAAGTATTGTARG